jgi:NTP pyrophosphatase (non-canonical NTP hydrolase)
MEEQIITQIQTERERQDAQWGRQDHGPQTWLSILVEEVGEYAKAILEQDDDAIIAEMIQVAAVAIAALEAFERHPTLCSAARTFNRLYKQRIR